MLKTPLAVAFTHSPVRVILELNAEAEGEGTFFERSVWLTYNDKDVGIRFVPIIGIIIT